MASKLTKATPQQGFLKFSMYGPPGSGKTATALLWAEGLEKASGKRTAFFDTERGSDPYTVKNPLRKFHPEAFDFDAVYTRSLAAVLSEIENLDTSKYGQVVIDSISHLWDAAIAAYDGKKVGKNEDKIPINAWGSIKAPYKRLIDAALYSGKFHAFVLGRQKNLFDSTDGEWEKVGVGMKAEGETQYEPMTCVRMSMDAQGNILAFGEKDRWSVLSGRYTSNPTFAAIEPMLSMLNGAHHEAEDEDERVAADGELMESMAAKSERKAEKSRDLLVGFQSRLSSSSTLEDVGAITTEMKKQKRYMLEEHVNALRELLKAVTERISTEKGGSL